MAHFIGYIQGNRGPASRLGSKASGVDVTARGWNIGGSAWVGHDEGKGLDFVELSIDGGSNHRSSKFSFRIYEGEDVDQVIAERLAIALKR